MQLREPFAKKHIHTWMKSFMHFDPTGYDIERKCKECGTSQTAHISHADKESLPESVLHLGDWRWE